MKETRSIACATHMPASLVNNTEQGTGVRSQLTLPTSVYFAFSLSALIFMINSTNVSFIAIRRAQWTTRIWVVRHIRQKKNKIKYHSVLNVEP